MTSTPDDDNPFAPPRALIGDRASEADLDIDRDAELIRLHHLSHETSIRSVGMLCYLGSALGVLFTCAGTIAAIGAMRQAVAPPGTSIELVRVTMWLGTAVWAIIAVLGFALGYGLRNLQAWARWTGMVLSVLSMLYGLLVVLFLLVLLGGPGATAPVFAVLFGIAIQGYVFYLLVAPKSGMVFSGEYRLIIQKTPEIRTRTSLIVKIALGLLVALLVLALFGIIAGAFR